MSRSKRAQVGHDTVEIVARGSYPVANGGQIDISKWVADCLQQTKVIAPGTADMCLSPPAFSPLETVISVINETTLAAARRLVVEGDLGSTLCLNFASAKNPGGGFLGGSQAQEESLARSSALYASLTTQNEYYDTNRACRTALYTDYMILSPNVPVFRDDEGNLLADPYCVSMLTSPAVNAGAIKKNEPDKEELIRPTMAKRIAKVLAVAAHHGYEHLILGAWGCGVFRNDPVEIAELFADALLRDGPFRNRFASVTFAVFDGTEDERIVRPFREQFAGVN